jgi:hypothetical protein
MRMIGASVLCFEALVVLLAIPVAITLADVDATQAVVAGVLLAVMCVTVAGLLRYPWGFAAGWVVQVLIVLSGSVVTAMFFLGGLFTVLWAVGLRVGRRGEELRNERWPDGTSPGRLAPPPAD